MSFWTTDPYLTLSTCRFGLFLTSALYNCWTIKGSISEEIDQFAHLSTGRLLFTCSYLCSWEIKGILPSRFKGDHFPKYLHTLLWTRCNRRETVQNRVQNKAPSQPIFGNHIFRILNWTFLWDYNRLCNLSSRYSLSIQQLIPMPCSHVPTPN